MLAIVPLNVGHMLINICSRTPLNVDDVDGHPSEVAQRSMDAPKMAAGRRPKRFLAILVLVEPSERFHEAREEPTGALQRHVARRASTCCSLTPLNVGTC